jgi:hypothetical protein
MPHDIIGADYSLHLPNIRSLFEPDPGHVLVEADLKSADAWTAAWDADARGLKEMFLRGDNPHNDNAQLLFGCVFEGGHIRRVRDIDPRHMHTNGMPYYDCAKRWIHATHFAAGARTVASVLALSQDHIERCQNWWREERHPEIGRWHRRVDAELRSRKMPVIHNAFGFRRVYTGGAPYGRSPGNLLGQALGWICQSTTAIVIGKAIERIDCSLDLIGRERCGACLVCRGTPWQLLLQNHDSELMQLPREALTTTIIDRLREACDVAVPYPDELHIPVEIKYSTSHWGNMARWDG